MAKKNIYFKFDMLILKMLSLGDCYGYEITQTIKNLSDDVIDVKEGSLYPIMYKMVDVGYVTSYEKVVNRKVRVYYHLEESGKKYLDDIMNEYLIWENKIKLILDYKGEIDHE